MSSFYWLTFEMEIKTVQQDRIGGMMPLSDLSCLFCVAMKTHLCI